MVLGEFLMINKENYFTAGQLADLYGIPKQTLLYYDKNKLLVPEFINDNGYRYYSVSQYLLLEIILNLRKLNVSIQDIKLYLKNRSTHSFEKLLQNKQKECDQIITDTLKIKKSLELSLASIKKASTLRLGQIELAVQTSKPLLLSRTLVHTNLVHERIKILAHHNQTTFSKKHFKEFSTGWIIAKNDFEQKKFNNTIQFFTPVPDSFSSTNTYLRPEGLYLTIHFQGTYYQKAHEVYAKIEEFLKLNCLKIISNIYVLPIKSHWLTEDITSYVNQISFQVDYIDNH